MDNGQEMILHKKTFRQLTTDELYELLRVRSEVFVVEQNCVYQDLDGDDQQAIHLWLTLGDRIVALARVCPARTHMQEISIGRRQGLRKTDYASCHRCRQRVFRCHTHRHRGTGVCQEVL